MLQGGYAAIGIGQTVTNTASSGSHNSTQGGDEEEEDLNVDEDDTHIYGPAQYVEADVIPPIAEQNGNCADGDVTSYMRRLITCSEGTVLHNSAEELPRTSVDILVATNTETYISQGVEHTEHQDRTKNKLNDNEQQNYPQIIESLKMKLRLFENQAQNKFKCLICLDDYKNPAISVACWHVHCEECWLRSLGARKLCPQCNLITTPKDLRRIYM